MKGTFQFFSGVTARLLAIALAALAIGAADSAAVEVGQIDDFQDGSTMGWQHGQPNQHAPRIAEDEGPDGTGDHALRVSSWGGSGPGGMMIMLNVAQWTGDFQDAGITGLEFELQHVSGADASIRVAVSDSPGPTGTWFASAEPAAISSGSSWDSYFLSLEPEDLVQVLGTASAEEVLSDVAEMRLLSSNSADYRGDAVQMELLYDNITAAGAAEESIGIDNLRVTEVDPEEEVVEVTNISPQPVSVGSALPFSYSMNELTAIPPGTEFDPGESKDFILPLLSSSDSDVWLYRDDDFSNPESILSGVKYGPESDVGRTSVAVAAGIWPDTSAFVPAPPTGDSIQLNSLDPTDPEHWISREPTPEEFFGTGERIEQPLPPEIPSGDVTVELELLADGLVSPVSLQDPDDGSGRLFVVDQSGVVRIVQDGVLQENVFMDVRDRMVTLNTGFDERGLIGFALHPDFPETPKVYAHVSMPADETPDFTVPRDQDGEVNHHAVIAEWQVSDQDPDAIDPASYRELLRIEEPQGNHNGGTVAFGPDGLLYISLGDGGSGDDVAFGHAPEGNAQNLGIILGGILRIDPDGDNSGNGQYGIPEDNPFVDEPGVVAEFFAYGLRNPYTFSFDSGSGEMYIGDAGQHDIEAIYLGEKGANYGWRVTEGSFYFRPQRPDGQGFVVTVPEVPLPDDLVNPLAEYTIRNTSRQVVVGGYVYRGSAIPELEGRYIFADWISEVFYLDEEDTIVGLGISENNAGLGDMRITGFGQDAGGEVYVMGSDTVGPSGDSGRIFRLTPAVRRLPVISVTLSNGVLRIDFASGFPAAEHRLEARPELGASPEWAEMEAEAVEIEPGIFRIEVPMPETPRHFFRVVGGSS